MSIFSSRGFFFFEDRYANASIESDPQKNWSNWLILIYIWVFFFAWSTDLIFSKSTKAELFNSIKSNRMLKLFIFFLAAKCFQFYTIFFCHSLHWIEWKLSIKIDCWPANIKGNLIIIVFVFIIIKWQLTLMIIIVLNL